MAKPSYLITIFTILLMFIGINSQVAYAATPLPPSSWYAVTFVKDTNTLHWINAQGEQGALSRPKLANEADNPFPLRMTISPNGQHMVVIAQLNNGNLGVGFYDFVAGQFVQAHETQPNEVLTPSSQLVYSFTGSHFAMSLRNVQTQEWRILVFETATGNAVDQLMRTSQNLPDTFIIDPTWYPSLRHFSVDEGIGQSYIGLQLVNDDPTRTMYPSFNWYHNPVPAIANNPIVPASLPYSPFAGHDVLRTTKAVAFTGFNEQLGAPANNLIGNFVGTQMAINQLPTAVVNGAGYTMNSPQWLKNGEWIGYRTQNGVNQPFYSVTSAQSDTSLPLGPNIGSIHSTPDGLVAVNALDWQLYHLTDTNIDAFAYQFGNMVFQSNNQPFSVIYSTEEGSQFTLPSLPTTPELNVAVAGNGQIQAPEQTCGTAPEPRLTVGEMARVTYTDGTDLNIRNAPSGDYLMQIAEGTVVNVVSGPSCNSNFFWWQIQFQSEGVTVGGWAAEGDSDDYYLEPYEITLAEPPQFVPTATLQLQVVTPVPTQQDLGFAPQPTKAPDLGILAPVTNCSKSPQSQMSVGMTAISVTDGTLAMRTNLSDPYPSNQIPNGLTLQVLDGPQCREDIRMWQVSTTLNGQQVVGWIAEGFGNKYYMLPA
jgi:hypothetical protein